MHTSMLLFLGGRDCQWPLSPAALTSTMMQGTVSLVEHTLPSHLLIDSGSMSCANVELIFAILMFSGRVFQESGVVL